MKTYLLVLFMMMINLSYSQSKEIDYCGKFKVGKKYILRSPKDKNPFEKQSKATVIIIAKKDGHILYCWHYDYLKKDKVTFSRSCLEFLQLTKN